MIVRPVRHRAGGGRGGRGAGDRAQLLQQPHDGGRRYCRGVERIADVRSLLRASRSVVRCGHAAADGVVSYYCSWPARSGRICAATRKANPAADALVPHAGRRSHRDAARLMSRWAPSGWRASSAVIGFVTYLDEHEDNENQLIRPGNRGNTNCVEETYHHAADEARAESKAAKKSKAVEEEINTIEGRWAGSRRLGGGSPRWSKGRRPGELVCGSAIASTCSRPSCS